jgi:predicted small lipoprotein YifL
MRKIAAACVIAATLSGCGQKTVIEIPGSGNNTVAVTISVREDKDVAISPATSVSQGAANSSGSSAVGGK